MTSFEQRIENLKDEIAAYGARERAVGKCAGTEHGPAHNEMADQQYIRILDDVDALARLIGATA